MLTQSKKLLNAVKKLYTKVTGGKTTKSDELSVVINGMAENYVGVNVIETSNITGLTTEQCETLKVGDIVVKLTSNQKHTYTVSYKEAGVGMCLTYVDASVSETVSYDYVTDAWVYNSTDITPLGGGSGGAKLYQHIISAYTYNSADDYEDEIVFTIYRSNNTPINSLSEVIEIFTSSAVTNDESSRTTGLLASRVDASGGGVKEARFTSYTENQTLNFTGDGSANNFTFHVKQDTATIFNIIDKIVEV